MTDTDSFFFSAHCLSSKTILLDDDHFNIESNRSIFFVPAQKSF